MTTDINGVSSGIAHIGQETAKLDRQTSQTVGTPASPAASGDRLSLTDSAYNLRDLESRIKQLPATDIQHVEKVRDALDSGNYRVDPAISADRLLAVEQALAKPAE
ncbi:MAG TPA: flagellar biosynthesis anti-sigma factor FlgM [Chromatiaceae bacterium]|nr:flagellar biosynthesis anti-sigma factor FlgM [Chromatiaceae bacterium]